MDNNWKTFGHKENKELLEKIFARKDFYGSILFLGPEGIGKKSLAMELAGQLLLGQNLEANPDFFLLDSGSQEVSVEKVRGLLEWLSLKPFSGKYKVAVINNAENLNVQSSNALLKSLEEPKPGTVIFLVSQNKPIKTVVSRCLLLRFLPLTVTEMKSFAEDRGLSSDPDMLADSFGRPAWLLKFLSGDAVFQRTRDRAKEMLEVAGKTQAEKILAINKLGQLETEELKPAFFYWSKLETGFLKRQPEKSVLIRKIFEAVSGLDKNFNKKLVLQRLFL